MYCGYSVQLVVEFEQPKYTIHYIILISIFGLIAFASLQLWRKQSFQHLPEHNESVFLFAVGAIFARYLECLCDKTRNNKYFKNIDSQQFNCDFNRFRNKNFLSFQSVDHYLWLTFFGVFSVVKSMYVDFVKAQFVFVFIFGFLLGSFSISKQTTRKVFISRLLKCLFFTRFIWQLFVFKNR